MYINTVLMIFGQDDDLQTDIKIYFLWLFYFAFLK